MTERARHSYAVGPDQIFGLIVRRVGVVAYRIPFLCGSFIECRIWKQTQAYDARRVSIK